MKKLITLLMLGLLAGCGGGSDDTPTTNVPSQPNPKHKSNGVDLPIPYFTEAGHLIRIVKQFEFGFSDSYYRGQTFHYGDRLQANEKLGDGRGCVVLQSLKTTDMGPILTQYLANVTPIARDVLGDEIPDDYRFYGVKIDFSVVGSGWLYCFRHESLGPVTLDDFRQHFAGYIEFN